MRRYLLGWVCIMTFIVPGWSQDLNTDLLRRQAYSQYYRNQVDSAAKLFQRSLENHEWNENEQAIHQAEILIMESLSASNTLQIQAGFEKINEAFSILDSLPVNVDTLIQKAWIAKGIIEFKGQRFPQSLQSWQTSQSYLRKFPSDKDTIKTYINLQNLQGGAYFRLGQSAKAKAAYLIAYEYFLEDNNQKQVCNTLSNLGNISFATEDYSGAAKAYTQAIEMAEANDPVLWQPIATSSMNLSYVLRGFGDYKGALEYAEKTQHAYQVLQNPAGEDKVKMLRALIYADRGDFQQAIELHKFYYRRIQNTFGPNSLEAKNILGNIALFYYSTEDFIQAEKYARDVIKIIEQFENLPPQYQATDFIILGSALVKLGREEEAQTYFDHAISLYEGLRANRDFQMASYYEAMGKLYLSTKDYEKAIDFAGKGEELWREKELASKSARISNLTTLVNAHVSQKDYDSANDIISQILALVQLPDFDPGTAPQLPHLAAVPNLSSLAQAVILFGDIQSNSSAKGLEASYNSFRLAADLMDSIRITRRERGWSMDSDYEVLYERDQIFDKGMATLYALYESTGDRIWVERALAFSERNKATLLAEAFSQQEAEQYLNIPSAILEREKSLRSRILQLEQQLLLVKERPGSPLEAEVPTWEEEIYEVRSSHDSLVQVLRKRYPDYYRLTYQTPKIDVEKLKGALRADEALVEYFVAEQTVYTLVLHGDEVHFLKMDLPENWRGDISAYHKEIYLSFLPQKVSKRAPVLLSQMAYLQYQRFWEPLKALDLPTDILLVPDAELGYLSFETLVNALPEDPELYSRWPFLIRDHNFRYTYAGSLLPEFAARSHHRARKRFVAFAPTYTDMPEVLASNRGELGNLPFAQKEAEQLHQLLGGTLFSGDEATESSFKAKAGDYQLIHIAGHALVDDQQGLSSHIIFTTDTTSEEDQRLQVKELFNLNLNADLVVLSACETGIGEMRRGEGIISLAWGMIYAGAKGVTTTLWQVNDQATEQLMRQFYQYLSQEMDKDKALRQAKLDYLDQGDDLSAHPYLWGSFVMVGDVSPISGNLYPWWWWAIGVFVLVAIGIRVVQSRRKRERMTLEQT